ILPSQRRSRNELHLLRAVGQGSEKTTRAPQVSRSDPHGERVLCFLFRVLGHLTPPRVPSDSNGSAMETCQRASQPGRSAGTIIQTLFTRRLLLEAQPMKHCRASSLRGIVVTLLAIFALLPLAIRAQDRLKGMPGHDQYQRMSTEIPRSVTLGTLSG